eukprot:3655314-Pyramimonas_sp.AAC.1
MLEPIVVDLSRCQGNPATDSITAAATWSRPLYLERELMRLAFSAQTAASVSSRASKRDPFVPSTDTVT